MLFVNLINRPSDCITSVYFGLHLKCKHSKEVALMAYRTATCTWLDMYMCQTHILFLPVIQECMFVRRTPFCMNIIFQ